MMACINNGHWGERFERAHTHIQHRYINLVYRCKSNLQSGKAAHGESIFGAVYSLIPKIIQRLWCLSFPLADDRWTSFLLFDWLYRIVSVHYIRSAHTHMYTYYTCIVCIIWIWFVCEWCCCCFFFSFWNNASLSLVLSAKFTYLYFDLCFTLFGAHYVNFDNLFAVLFAFLSAAGSTPSAQKRFRIIFFFLQNEWKRI